MAKKKEYKRTMEPQEEKVTQNTFSIASVKNMVQTISYLVEDGSVVTLNINPMGSVEIPLKYRTQFIKFINQGLIKIL